MILLVSLALFLYLCTRMRRYHFSIFFTCLVLTCVGTSCEWLRKYRQGDALVEVDGQKLYQATVDEITRNALTPADSTQIADAFIAQWMAEATLYAKAQRAVHDHQAIEQLVENYRRTLYVQAYEQLLVEREMPKHVEMDSIQAYYDTHSEAFVLEENLIRGLLIVVPVQAPSLKDLRKWLQTIDEVHLEKIEKYAYQNASGYELFTEQWQTLQNIILRMPLEQNNLAQQLRQRDIIEMSDSINTYFLRVTDKRLVGEPMPLEYAKPEIEQIILNQRKIEFINNIR